MALIHLFQLKGVALRYTGVASTRESFPRCVSEPVLVISITLEGMPDTGPPRVFYESLAPYLRGGIAYAVLQYNFNTAKGMNSYVERANSLVDMVRSGCLKG